MDEYYYCFECFDEFELELGEERQCPECGSTEVFLIGG